MYTLIVGAFNDEGPPVPISNTEVKLISAEDTCLATDWENRSVPTQSLRVSEAFFIEQVIGGNLWLLSIYSLRM